ncbi:MAG: V-type ATP synthase subunit E [Eubacterium sp.]|nr:V-type ATP synthase subunit E [Eubacterium sp.]
MSGLDKILEEIRTESKASQDAILQDAQSKVSELNDAKDKEIEAKVREILAGGEKEADEIRSRAQSSAELLHRQQLLAARQEIISDMISASKDYILNLSDDEYFSLVSSLIIRNARKGQGEIVFGRKDRERIPSAFLENLAKTLPEGCKLTLAEETAPVDGGCILRYGGIEENCSIEAVFNEKKDELQDLVRKILF